MGVIGCYGSWTFVCADDTVRTFSDFSRDYSMRWAQHDVIGQKPKLELVGRDLTTVSLKVRCDVSLGVPPSKWLAKLERMLNNGWHKKLIIGDTYYGQFVLESVGETLKNFDGQGHCIVAEATLNLKEWAR